MACKRGKAHPNSATKLMLFTNSGGYFQNPDCNTRLFANEEKIHFAEMAHIFAARDDGPRANEKLNDAEKGDHKNIILLCDNCHTLIDKDQVTYTDKLICHWKLHHTERIATIFGIQNFDGRGQLRSEIQKLLEENKSVHRFFGPDNEYRFNPEAPEVDAWKARVLSTVIPNSTLIIRHLDANTHLLTREELDVLADFKTHVRGLVLRHIVGDNDVNTRFPEKMNGMAG